MKRRYNKNGDFMDKKKLLTIIGVALVIALIIFLVINMFAKTETPSKNNEKSNENKEDKQAIAIDYQTYQELRSEVHEKETFAILIMNTDDEVSATFKEEVLYSFKDRKANVYEIYIDKLDDVSQSSIIADVTKIMGYDKPTIMIPTLLVSKYGKIVYKQELLVYSPEIISNLDDNKIE